MKLMALTPFGAIPNERQLLHYSIGKKAFFHVGVNTFTDVEHGNGKEDSTLFAPTDARVDQAFDTAHALTLITDGGAELLLHVGIDTVELQGKHFELLVGAGDRVRAGDALIRFDRSAIIAADYHVITPLVVGNSDEYDLEVLATGDVKVGTPLIRLKRKEATT